MLYFSFKGKPRDLNSKFFDQRITDIETSMKNADTSEKQVDTILTTKDIMQRELLFDVEFYAFLNAYMYLKMKTLEDDIKHVMEQWILEKGGNQQPSIPGSVSPGGIPIDIPSEPKGESEGQRKAREE